MARRWWEKLLQRFMEETSDEKENLNRRLGRMEEVERAVLPRVLHRYPRNGRLGVPVAVDQKEKAPTLQSRTNKRKPDVPQGTTPHRTRKQPETPEGPETKDIYQPPKGRRVRKKQSTAQNPETRPIREKFTGVNFRVSDVPSPVYGFRKRPSLTNKELNDERQQVNHSDTGNERISPERNAEMDENHTLFDYGYPARKTAVHETPEEAAKNKDGFQENRFLAEQPQQMGKPQQNRLEEPLGNLLPTEQLQQIGRKDTFENDLQDHHPKVEQPSERHESTCQEHGRALSEVPKVPSNIMMLEGETDRQHRNKRKMKQGHRLPPLHLLAAPPSPSDEDEDWINEQRGRLAETLEHFNVQAQVVGVTKGPAVTRFEVQPSPGVKVSKIKKLSDDLKLSLAAKDIRIEAPIPGKNTVGIEIPNSTSTPVSLREMIETRAFQDSDSPLTAALGLDISGKPIITDLQKMPHGLISGATGSGKSVCINSLLVSLLYKATPDELKMILIDPKVVELAPFKDIPHLAAPVINDPKEASLALKWAVDEMERRYECFAEVGARDIARYNRRMNEKKAAESKMPYIVIVIDELADLMMVAAQDVEESICRIAQKARACGIHLVLATQRPSVDVITGLIKANIPTRIAFSVSSQADSRTILDMSGAEKLLGHGDMLFVENGAPQPVRVQGNFVSDDEIDDITAFVKNQDKPRYLFEKEELKQTNADNDTNDDELFEDAGFFVFEQGTASTSSLQRHFHIGYNRAARLIDMMEARGMISEVKGSKPRQLLMSEDEFLEKVLKIEA